MKAPLFCNINKTSQNRYGYVSNLCVSKSARRQGIASNMLHFAVELAILDGKIEVEQVSGFLLSDYGTGKRSHLILSLCSCLIIGVEQVYVHVHRDNGVAQELYRKMGFEVRIVFSNRLSSTSICCSDVILQYKKN